MKFPLLANAFGQQKVILEIGGNAIGLSEPRYQPQRFRRHRVQEIAPRYDAASHAPRANGRPLEQQAY